MEAREVFAGPFDDFVALRKSCAAQARVAGDRAAAKAVLGWRKPTRGAWLVNLLSRFDPDGVAEALELGESLAEAHRTADAQQLRELSGIRRRLIDGLVRRAVDLAGERGYAAPDAVRAEVADTLTAGLADTEVADAIRQGTLSRTVRAAGFGPADLFAPLADVIELRPRTARPAAPEGSAPADSTPEETAPQEGATVTAPEDSRAQVLARLAGELDRLEAAYAERKEAAEAATREAEDAAGEAQRAERCVGDAESAVTEARAALTRAEQELTSARDDQVRLSEVAEGLRVAAAERERASAEARDALDALRAEVARVVGISSGPT